MAYIIIPGRSSKKPATKPSVQQEFKKSLVFCFLPEYGDISPNKSIFTLQGVGSYVSGNFGKELKLVSTGYDGNGLIVNCPYYVSAPYTILAHFSYYSSVVYSTANLLELGPPGSGIGWGFNLSNTLSYRAGMYSYAGFSIPTGVPVSILCRVKEGAGGKLQFMSNTQEDPEIADPGHYGGYGTPVRIGGIGGYGTINGGLTMLSFWNRQLSIEESRYIVKNPFSILEKHNNRTYFDIPAAVVPDVGVTRKPLTLNADGGLVNPTLLGSGTPAGDTFLRGDGTWQTL